MNGIRPYGQHFAKSGLSLACVLCFEKRFCMFNVRCCLLYSSKSGKTITLTSMVNFCSNSELFKCCVVKRLVLSKYSDQKYST